MNNNFVLTGFADEISPSLDEQIRVFRSLNINHIEMRSVEGKPLIAYSTNEAKEIKAKLDEAGFMLSSVGSSIGKYSIHDDFASHFELFKHAVEIAHIMGTKNIRMFSFYIPRDEDPEASTDEVLRRIGMMVEYAKKEDVVLLHENEKEIYGDIATRCRTIMEKYYCDNFKAVFDFANFIQCGQDTEEAYEMLRPYIAYIHVKDAMSNSGKVVPAGKGDGNIASILKKVKNSGYHGYLSLEPHLADFAGFKALGDSKSIKQSSMTSTDAFVTAYDALEDILKTI
jgi:sugar phosphate isomerase/epimerase